MKDERCCYMGCGNPNTRRYVDFNLQIVFLCEFHANLLNKDSNGGYRLMRG